MTYARTVQFQIKQGKQDEFVKLLNHDVLPVLKQQDGFKSELALISEGRASATSVWRDRESATKYEKETYPTIVRTLNPVMEGAASVRTSDVALAMMA